MFEAAATPEKSAVYTVTASCQDCYRCVRACPVKAIRVSRGQAQIEDDLCIQCGTCVRECPQHAKVIRSSLEEARALLGSGRPVAASLAPSFPALWRDDSAKLPDALRRLGFAHVCETAEGAKLVTEASLQARPGGSVCTACPAVVRYVEKYRPEYLDRLIPIASPMVAHARLIKKRWPDCAVVFIGPCAAKKAEARRPENRGAVDVVLTFAEAAQWLAAEGVELKDCGEAGFDPIAPVGRARLFPVEGGMLKTGDVQCDGTSPEIMHLSGAEAVMGLFSGDPSGWSYSVVEPLFCEGGCVNGPGMDRTRGIFERRLDVLRYAEKAKEYEGASDRAVETGTQFKSAAVAEPEVTEEQIAKVLAATGKSDPRLQLNCGACGYHSCRENAVAVIRGLAEPEMCMPYMRRMAQQRGDRIFDTSPNGLVVLDRELTIMKMNRSFMEMFHCGSELVGRRISYVAEAEGFEQLLSGETDRGEAIRSRDGRRYHEYCYAMRDERQYIGIFSDLSGVTFDRQQINLIKNQTLFHVRELLDNQISFSQEMAQFLGASTAKSEELAKRLMDLYQDEAPDAGAPSGGDGE